MKSKEINAFEEKYGFKPTAIGVALDSLAVFVNKDNPIEVLSLEEVDAIFSRTRKGGHPDVTTWDQLGLSGDWSNRAISLYGRNSASGTYGYFKSNALFKGDYKSTVKEQPGSASVVLGVTEELGSIGYSGIGYKTSGVRALPLSRKKGEEAYETKLRQCTVWQIPTGPDALCLRSERTRETVTEAHLGVFQVRLIKTRTRNRRQRRLPATSGRSCEKTVGSPRKENDVIGFKGHLCSPS